MFLTAVNFSGFSGRRGIAPAAVPCVDRPSALLSHAAGFMSNRDMTQPHRAPLHHAALLQARDLCFSWPGRALFSHWSADVPAGVSLLRGDDGTGKTTLLRLLAGQLPVDAGELRIHGQSLRDAPEAYRAQVFFTEPRTGAFDALTPPQYFEAQRLRYPGFDTQALDRLVSGLALDEQLGKQLFMLSTGSRRKVFLAAAFASGAALTLLDMPFAALDKASISCVREWLDQAASQTTRAWVLADYAAPAGLQLARVIDLG
jgi:ABC-type multidrug transport system ATPase subunit